MVINNEYDATVYEQCSSERRIHNLDLLYESFQKSKKDSIWKESVQKYEISLLYHLLDSNYNLKYNKYKFDKGYTFIINERGKTRVITGDTIKDRVIKHAICDEILTPTFSKYLIYDNSASIKNKGVDFARKRLIKHLRQFYLRNGSNDGYILLADFSKYYDNIEHERLMDIFKKYIDNPIVLSIVQTIIDRQSIDVSYMDAREYENCMNGVFNSIEYEKIPKELLTKEKFMHKHLNIGDQVSQIAGTVYPIKFDNYVKIVLGIKEYARYQDDFYIIHKDKDYLKNILNDLRNVARENGMFLNEKKTRISKLSSTWRYLKIKYSLTETGAIFQRIHPKLITRMRRKMKKVYLKMSEIEFNNWYNSWYNHYKKYMSKQQKDNMNNLYRELCNTKNVQT